MLYAGYYNLKTASQASSPASSAANSRRPSEKESVTSAENAAAEYQPETQRRRSSIKRALDMLRPTEEPLTPEGVYAPIIKRGPLFHKKEKKEKKKEELRWNLTKEQYELISAAG